MKKKPSILKLITYWILISVVTAFIVSTIAFYAFSTIVSKNKSEQLLANNIEDMQKEIMEADSLVFNLSGLNSARNIEKRIIDPCQTYDKMQFYFERAMEETQAVEMFLVDSLGIVRAANDKKYIGYDMHSTELSRSFLHLLDKKHTTSADSAYTSPLVPKGIFHNAPLKYIAGMLDHRKGFVVFGLKKDYVTYQMNFMLSGSAHYRRVGERGKLFIFDDKHNIVSAPMACKAKSMAEVGIDKKEMENLPEKELFETNILGERCLCYHSYLIGYHMLAVQPCSESTFNRDTALKSRSITGSIVFILLFLVIWLIVRRLVRSVKRINKSLVKITEGNLNERLKEADTEEFQQVSEHTNKMVDTLQKYIQEAENRVVEDLALAKAIQSSTLPSVFPAFPDHQEFDIHALMKTARKVGGDFYDFFFVGENKLALVMADVAGKGIPAAMFMMRSKSALKNHTSTGLPLAQVCFDVNNMLCQANDTNTFFTCWIGVFDLKTGMLTYVNAGHCRPLIHLSDSLEEQDNQEVTEQVSGSDEAKKSKKFQYLDCIPNIPMAAFENFPYKEQTLQMKQGDELFLYTDGVTEATSTSLELFGDQRLLDVFNTMSEDVASSCRGICLNILQEVQLFATGAEQSDDMTILSFKYFGLPE